MNIGDLVSRTWRLPAAAVLAAVALTVTAGTAQAAAPQVARTTTTQATQAAASPRMTPQQWSALKSGLSASTAFTRTVAVSGGVRTLTFTTVGRGASLELREPAASADVLSPNLSVGGWGFLQVCAYLNRTDQKALRAGAAAAIGAALCLISGPVCVAAAAALAIAFVYIGDHGYCASRLRVRLLPIPGSARCVS